MTNDQMNQTDRRCPFCFELHRRALPVSDQQALGVKSRIVHATENFAVLVDISPLVVGHVLIVSQAHYLSFGRLPDEIVPEYDALIALVATALRERWHAPVFMEHGTGSAQDGGACIAHAHLQVLPAPLDMLTPMQALRPQKLERRREVVSWGRADRSYVFLEDEHGACYVADHLEALERQFIRRVAAAQLGISDPDWDWRAVQRKEIFRQTHRALREYPWLQKTSLLK